ncbi:MAG: ATP-binding protein [Thermoanaerobaculia bacterium]
MSSPSEPPGVHLAIESRLENIDLVQVVVEESLTRLDLEQEAAQFVGLAVREAVANAIRHGNREDPDKRVEIDFHVEAGEVVIVVQDEGEGFDPAQVPDPLQDENLLRPNGRGLLFMRNFMDSIEYSERPGGGTVVTLRKRLSAGEATSNEPVPTGDDRGVSP